MECRVLLQCKLKETHPKELILTVIYALRPELMSIRWLLHARGALGFGRLRCVASERVLSSLMAYAFAV